MGHLEVSRVLGVGCPVEESPALMGMGQGMARSKAIWRVFVGVPRPSSALPSNLGTGIQSRAAGTNAYLSPNLPEQWFLEHLLRSMARSLFIPAQRVRVGGRVGDGGNHITRSAAGGSEGQPLPRDGIPYRGLPSPRSGRSCWCCWGPPWAGPGSAPAASPTCFTTTARLSSRTCRPR